MDSSKQFPYKDILLVFILTKKKGLYTILPLDVIFKVKNEKNK